MHFVTVLLVVCSAYLNSSVLGVVQFRVIRQWKYLNYTWPTYQSYQTSRSLNLYIPENIVTAGVMYYENWFYLTMPRMKNGVPATLGRIPASSGGTTAPLIAPFPSWEFNKLGDCNALQNVQNIEIDLKSQMWIIDGGHTATLSTTPDKTCPPKLILFDIQQNTTIMTYVFPENVASKSDSFLYDLVVDNNFAYITDNSRRDPGIIVFSLAQNHAWKIRHNTMRAEPSAQHFKVDDVSISSPINIAGIALGPQFQENNTNEREVFYCPLSSLHLYSLSTSVLRNESSSNNGLDYPGFVTIVGRKASQTDGMIMTNQGVLYYGLLTNNSIAKWDSRTPFASGQKIVSKDLNYIQWTNSFTMDLQGNMIVLTNTLQEFIYKELNLTQHNFWLLSANTGEKSYLYSTSEYDSNVAQNATSDNTNNALNVMHSDSPAAPNQKPDLMQSTPAPDEGTQQVLDFCLIILLFSFWFSYHI